jgi:cytochrome P450
MPIPLIPTIAGCLLLSLVVYRFVIIPVFLSALSKVPNAHWSAPLSPLWILYHRLVQNDTPTVHAAHGTLGPIIRLGPNELSVNCVEGGIRTIYGGGYDKGDWYSNVFSNYGVHPMFAMPERNPHSKRKRMLSNIYAKSTLQASESVAAISHKLLDERLTPRLKAIAETDKSVEVYDVFSSITMDFVASYVFGLENASDFIRQPEYAANFLKDYKARQLYQFWPQELPGLTSWLDRFGMLGLVVPSWVAKANNDIEAWIMAMCDKAERSMTAMASEKKPTTSAADYPTVYAQLRQSILKDAAKSKCDISEDQVIQSYRLDMASEMLDHVLAGFDTSSITLTWLAWELSRAPNALWQTKLREEITGLQGSKDAKQIDQLPILNACLMETLRVHAAIPGNQPRMTPSSASLGDFENLPAGIRVQSQAWSLHRNPDVYPEPDSWQPSRWLDADEAQLREMNKWFWAFGSGGRMCVGSNLATLEMKNVMISIWGQFSTEVAEDEGMVHNGGYLAEPLGKDGKFLLLKFTALSV